MRFYSLIKIIYSTCLIMSILFFGCSSGVDTMKRAPDFTLIDLLGNNISLDQYEGNIVILDFWATWCPPCQRSIPELVELQEKYRDQGLVILGISLDNPMEVNNRYLSAYKKKYNINYRILRADEETVVKYFGNSTFSIPTLFVVNREGVIVDKHVGFTPGTVERSLENLV